jgi:hypothetical protein
MLYVLGAVVLVFGIVIFVAQIWNDISSLGRIVITLGLGLLITALGSVLLEQKPKDNIGPTFHFVGGMLIPSGAVVLLSELNFLEAWTIAIAFVVVFAFYLLLNTLQKHALLTFFAIANATAAIYLLTYAIVEAPHANWFDNIYQYLTMTIGTSYLLLAHAFRGSWNKQLIGALYVFGSAGFLGAAFTLVFDSTLWQLLFFLIVFCGLALSVYTKSRIILVVGTLFLLIHVSYITGEYFSNSLGWPISLVILGFVFIGLGYTSITINKKYIKGTNR